MENKIAPKGSMPRNQKKCSKCKYWNRVSKKKGVCKNISVYFFAESNNKLEIKTPRFGLCNNFVSKYEP